MSYQATLKPGAKAYSVTGMDWGNAIADENGRITIVSTVQVERGSLEVVDVPRWSNGKRWAIDPDYIERIPDDGGEVPPESQVDLTDIMEHKVGGIVVEKFARLIE